MLPARELPLDPEAIGRFRAAWRARFEGNPNASPVYRDVSEGFAPAGIEYWLPLFFDRTGTAFDYLPGSTLVVELPGVREQAKAFWEDTAERYEQRRHDAERPVLTPRELFLAPDELGGALAAYPRAIIREEPEEPHPPGGRDGLAAPPPAPRPPPPLPAAAPSAPRARLPAGTVDRARARRPGRVRHREPSRPSRRSARIRPVRPLQAVPRQVPGPGPDPRRIPGAAGDPRGDPAAPRASPATVRRLARVPARSRGAEARRRPVRGRTRGDPRPPRGRDPARGASLRPPRRRPPAGGRGPATRRA